MLTDSAGVIPARLLLVGADPQAATSIVEMLWAGHPDGGLLVTQTPHVSDAVEELADHGDSCVLLALPDASDPLASLRELTIAAPAAAIIVICEQGDDALGVAALRAGAQDHIVRSELYPARLARAVEYAIERKRAETRLTLQALIDPLTELPNRVLFRDRLSVALDRSRRTGLAPAVMFLDLDSFKHVNDSLGHAAGDELLRVLAGRYRELLRPMDTVARVGGDEFTFLFEGLTGDEEAVAIAHRIRDATARPVALGGAGGQRAVSASIGIAMLDDPAVALEQAVGDADAAMYRAKHLGGGRAELFVGAGPVTSVRIVAEPLADDAPGVDGDGPLPDQDAHVEYEAPVDLESWADDDPWPGAAVESEPAVEPGLAAESEPAEEPWFVAEPEPAEEPGFAVEYGFAAESGSAVKSAPAGEPELAEEPGFAMEYGFAAESAHAVEPGSPGPSDPTAELRAAVRDGELRVHYQPRVSINGQTGLVGFEALVRWEHPRLGLLGPDRFIELAESSGLICEIGDWVLQQALREVRRWRQTRPGVTISVNVSGRQLSDADFAGRLAQALKSADADPSVLWLDVPEEAAIGRLADAVSGETLATLSDLGVNLAVDDFGFGQGSLQSLRDLPVDMLKIDGSFVSALGSRADDSAVIGALVELGHALGLSVVAEGVETDRQLAQLRDLGCDGAQGFLFSQPVPEGSVRELLGIA